MTDQFFFSFDVRVACGSPCGDNNCLGLVLLAGCLDGEQSCRFVLDYGNDIFISKARSEFFCLFLHAEHEIRPHDSFRKAGEVFHFSCCCQLTADLGSRDDKRSQVGPGCINGSCVSGAAGSNDNDVFAHDFPVVLPCIIEPVRVLTSQKTAIAYP